MCDNDNDNDDAVVEGEAAGAAGTLVFMAPDLVRQEPGAQPGVQTDPHPLAMLPFMLPMSPHPPDGAKALRIGCMDEAAQRQLYGTDRCSPSTRGTTAPPDLHGQRARLVLWGVLPKILRDLFVATFTDGLRKPGLRVRESQWRDALRTVLDAITACRGCGKRNLTQPGGAPPHCWRRGKLLVLPPALDVVTGTGALCESARARWTPRRGATPTTSSTTPSGTTSPPWSARSPTPRQPGRCGLTNRTGDARTVRRDDGTRQEVAPGRTMALRPGLLLGSAGARRRPCALTARRAPRLLRAAHASTSKVMASSARPVTRNGTSADGFNVPLAAATSALGSAGA
ncbi:hypothetical protein [Streptomyces sp. PT12]|uniref:hypothetical protein n=1 Tax=Streptomyces sp. PT12 TaxID=1510197 RepID=UPI001C67A402|nr:hypothetical protein [Streptomyces sp. PT12]